MEEVLSPQLLVILSYIVLLLENTVFTVYCLDLLRLFVA